MKIKYWLFSIGLMGSGLLSACRLGNGGTKITAGSDRDTYHFTASYHEELTEGVEQYINQQVKPTNIFTPESHTQGMTVILEDHTTFHIKSENGKLKIEMNKRNNSKSSYQRLVNLCDGVRNFILNQRKN